jgi:DNA-binding transcriptional LysR family regulator
MSINRLHLLRVLCACADTGSFKKAAMQLGVSPQVVTRAIQELEALQSEVLFHRNTRGVRITEFGALLAARARHLIDGCDALFPDGHAVRESAVDGVVRVTAPTHLGRTRVAPLLTRLARQHPQLRIELKLSDARVDVVDDRIDIGLRLGFVRDNRYVARKLAKMAFHVVATPGLIDRHGAPRTLDDLQRLPLSAMFDVNTGRPWPWLFSAGRQMTPEAPKFLCDDIEAEGAAVLSGVACGQLPDYLVEPHLRSGRLVSLLRKFEPDPWDIYIFRPQRKPLPARVALVFDAMLATMHA